MSDAEPEKEADEYDGPYLEYDELPGYGYVLCSLDPDLAARWPDLSFVYPTSSAALHKVNPAGPEPTAYAEFAKLDLGEGGARGVINAIGNAKRAVHLGMDGVFRLIGLEKAVRRASFPQRVAMLSELGAFPVGMIDRLNRVRNTVEHDYITVDVDRASELVEVAEMFAMLCGAYYRETVVGYWFGQAGSDALFGWHLSPLRNELVRFLVSAPVEIIEGADRIPFSDHYGPDGEREERSFEDIERVDMTKANSDAWRDPLRLMLYLTRRGITPVRYHRGGGKDDLTQITLSDTSPGVGR